MTLSLSLSPDAEARLRAKADTAGEALDVYAARVLEEAARAPGIDQLLEPVRQQAARSGMSEIELMDFGRDLLGKVREERRANAS